MAKLDLKKELKHLYNPSSKEPEFVDVPPLNYLMIDGQGQPDGTQAVAAIETLYPVAYTRKFTKKKELGLDDGVPPRGGLWWSDDMTDFTEGRRDRWRWTYMIMQPDFITPVMVEKAVVEVRRKKQPAAIDKIRFQSLTEGKAAQIMHIGPYSEEGPNIQKLHHFITNAGHSFDGQKQKHHEIYLSDPRRAAPEKLKTIIRQPMG